MRSLVGASCATHPATSADWTCGRCGTFFCEACAHRVRPNSVPMCGGCWALRERTVKPQRLRGTALQTAGLVCGVLALIPNYFFQLFALVVCVVGLLTANDEESKRARWKPIIGLVLTAIGTAIIVGFWFAAPEA